MKIDIISYQLYTNHYILIMVNYKVIFYCDKNESWTIPFFNKN